LNALPNLRDLSGVKAMSDKAMSNRARLVYQGPLGRIFCEGASFFASQNGSLVVTCKTFDEAIEMLAGKGRAKAHKTSLVNALGSSMSR
jgi:hypothetical protein